MEVNQTKLEYNKVCCIYLIQNGQTYYQTKQLFYYKSGQLLQIGRNLLQIRAGITYRGNYYKLVHNKLHFLNFSKHLFDNGVSFKLFHFVNVRHFSL